MATKAVNAQIDEELHRKLKVKLARDGLTYKEWVTKQIKKYVEDQ